MTGLSVVAVLAVALATGACGGAADQALPEGTVVLPQNIPTDVGGVEMVAVNIDVDGAAIASPAAPDGQAVAVVPDDVVTLGDVTVRVVAVHDGGSTSDGPGRGEGWIGVLPAG